MGCEVGLLDGDSDGHRLGLLLGEELGCIDGLEVGC